MRPLGWILLGTLCYSPLIYAELRDPTLPQGQPIGQTGAFTNATWDLNAIIISPTRQVAIINNTVVKIGDLIDNAKVIAIKSNSVELDTPGGRITLFFFDVPIKQAVQPGKSL